MRRDFLLTAAMLGLAALNDDPQRVYEFRGLEPEPLPLPRTGPVIPVRYFTESPTHVDGFRPDRAKPKKPGFRPKKLRRKRQ